jgi:hypothetical protein
MQVVGKPLTLRSLRAATVSALCRDAPDIDRKMDTACFGFTIRGLVHHLNAEKFKIILLSTC